LPALSRDNCNRLPYAGSPVKRKVRATEDVEAHFSARLLLVASALGDYTSKFSDYKKFRVETVTGTLKN
jgi:hypothetical protein